jgi:Cu-Zn family superoxide dismutase
MRGARWVIGGLAVVGLAVCCAGAADVKKTGAKKTGPAEARAAIEARSGSGLSGTAIFTEKDGGVELVVDVAGAPPGPHAVHLHEKGDCSAPDATSAGGHFNPDNSPHGAPDAEHHHAGDFGNMTVGEDGKGHLAITTNRLTVKAGANSVVGHAIIVHASADDMTTQPTGNAGGRIGCGVVK